MKFIGVGVGSGITSSSLWVSDPGAGYKYVWEKGSWSYEQRIGLHVPGPLPDPHQQLVAVGVVDALQVQLHQRRPPTDMGWTTITQAEYTARREPGQRQQQRRRDTHADVVTGLRHRVHGRQHDRRRDRRLPPRTGGKSYTPPYLDWEPFTGTRTGDTNMYRSTKVYNSPPYEGFEPAFTANTVNSLILARLVAGNDYGVPAVWNGTTYTNAEEADMYVLPQWSQFAAALQAVALGKCGGTLTLQTKLNGATAVPDPFTYQNSGVTDADGTRRCRSSRPWCAPTSSSPPARSTSRSPTAASSPSRSVRSTCPTSARIQPIGWSCRAGVNGRSVTAVPIADSVWSGIRVQVGANEAVSCTLSVSRV